MQRKRREPHSLATHLQRASRARPDSDQRGQCSRPAERTLTHPPLRPSQRPYALGVPGPRSDTKSRTLRRRIPQHGLQLNKWTTNDRAATLNIGHSRPQARIRAPDYIAHVYARCMSISK